jgi:hypothetical protein
MRMFVAVLWAATDHQTNAADCSTWYTRARKAWLRQENGFFFIRTT